MQVLEDQQDRRLGGETGQQLKHAEEQAVPLGQHVARLILIQ